MVDMAINEGKSMLLSGEILPFDVMEAIVICYREMSEFLSATGRVTRWLGVLCQNFYLIEICGYRVARVCWASGIETSRLEKKFIKKAELKIGRYQWRSVSQHERK